MGDRRSRLRNHQQKDIYPAARFRYDECRDTYKCPAGRRLYRHHFNRHRGYYDYRTRPAVCGRCALAQHCTRSKAGRSLNRYPGHHLLERARRQSPTARRRGAIASAGNMVAGAQLCRGHHSAWL
jgi:Transposase DDE domain